MKKMVYACASALIVAGCGGSVSNGDKVNLDKFSFTASYRDLPRNALDTSYHTILCRLIMVCLPGLQ